MPDSFFRRSSFKIRISQRFGTTANCYLSAKQYLNITIECAYVLNFGPSVLTNSSCVAEK
jgi:hypothetical protein